MAVLSTTTSIGQAIARAKVLRASLGNVTIVATSDCTNLKPGLFLPVAGIFNDSDEVQREVAEARKVVHDAYARACDPEPGSCIELGIDAVDRSIYDVLSNAVNWDDRDRLSEVHPAGGMYVWFRRQYLKDPNDAREGRRTSVSLFRGDPSSARRING